MFGLFNYFWSKSDVIFLLSVKVTKYHTYLA